MKITPARRAVYPFKKTVRTAPIDPLHDAGLRRMAALTEVVICAWCAARAASDLLRGPLSIEGGVALALCLIVSTRLVAKAIRWAARRDGPWQEDPRSASWTPTIVPIGDSREG